MLQRIFNEDGTVTEAEVPDHVVIQPPAPDPVAAISDKLDLLTKAICAALPAAAKVVEAAAAAQSPSEDVT